MIYHTSTHVYTSYICTQVAKCIKRSRNFGVLPHLGTLHVQVTYIYTTVYML